MFILVDPKSHEMLLLTRRFLKLLPGGFLMSFHEITTREQAKRFIGWELASPVSQIEPLSSPGEYYYFQLFGLTAVNAESGEVVGRVVNIVPHLLYELLDVELLNGERRFFPFIERVVRKVDLKEKKIELVVEERW